MTRCGRDRQEHLQPISEPFSERHYELHSCDSGDCVYIQVQVTDTPAARKRFQNASNTAQIAMQNFIRSMN